jgi:hypothetical protein
MRRNLLFKPSKQEYNKTTQILYNLKDKTGRITDLK